MEPRSQMLRLSILAFGCVLVLISVWILSAEQYRSTFQALPESADAAAQAVTQRDDAHLAALIGALRGNLWADSAYSYSNLDWVSASSGQPPEVGEAKSAIMRTLSLMPANSGIWLFLAVISSRFGLKEFNPLEALKMSYYTGSNELELLPLRLVTSARLDVSDPELQRLFTHEIETALTGQPELRPFVAAAYAQATSQNRLLMKDVITRIDPTFAQSLVGAAAK